MLTNEDQNRILRTVRLRSSLSPCMLTMLREMPYERRRLILHLFRAQAAGLL